jgi:hypothetical protein
VDVLYEGEYFGFKESAYDYVDWILNEINTSINRKQKKPAPPHFSKYREGLYYVSYKRNANTTWYVFFSYDSTAYYIYYIGNNHTCSQYL